MQKLLETLRSWGPLGSLLANFISLLTANYVIALGAILSILAGLSDWAVGLAHRPGLQTAILVFLVLLWTYIGFTILKDRGKPRVITPAQDYRYGLTFEALIPAYDPEREDAALQIGIQLRNYSSGPIRFTVESFDVRIETRALPKLKKGVLTSYMPRGGGRLSSNVPFKKSDIKEFMGKRVTGTAEFSIVYGHPERQPERRLTMLLNLTMDFREGGPLGWHAGIGEEKDEPIG